MTKIEFVVLALFALFACYRYVRWIRNGKMIDLRDKVDGIPFISQTEDGMNIVINLKDRKMPEK